MSKFFTIDLYIVHTMKVYAPTAAQAATNMTKRPLAAFSGLAKSAFWRSSR